jgi:hypothetical protein
MPDVFKLALVVPHLKKPSLSADILSNYRPVSNLKFLAKVIEKCVAKQLCDHLSKFDLEDELQSTRGPTAPRPHSSKLNGTVITYWTLGKRCF